MSSGGWQWSRDIRVGNPRAKNIMRVLGDRAHDSKSKVWDEKLSGLRHLPQSKVGIYLGGLTQLVEESEESRSTVKRNMRALQAAGLIWPGPAVIAEAYAAAGNRVPRTFELNDAIRGKMDTWVEVALAQAGLWETAAGAKKSKYGSLSEAMQDLVPLGDVGFEWVEPDIGTDTAGHWRPIGYDRRTAATGQPARSEASPPLRAPAKPRPSTKATPSNASRNDAETVPNPWVTPAPTPAAEAQATDPGSPSVTKTPESTGEETPEGFPPLPKEPGTKDGGGPAWRRKHYRWEQTRERSAAKRNGKPRNSECAWLLMDWWWQQQQSPPVGKDEGKKFIAHTMATVQAMLNEGHEPDRIRDTLITLQRAMPPVDQVRDVLTGAWDGKPRRGGGRGIRAMDSVREASALAGRSREQSDEERLQQEQILRSLEEPSAETA